MRKKKRAFKNTFDFNFVKKRFYDEGVSQDEYVDAQVKRHKAKAYKKRDKNHYLECCDKIYDLVEDGSEMICLGTRNNHERDVWREGLKDKNVSVSSLDISPESNADFVMDFSNFPKDWNEKWDIIFSNSLDHAPNPNITLEKWFSILKEDGIIVIGFDKGTHEVNEADCSLFDIKKVDESFKSFNPNYEYFDEVDGSYKYYILRKKKANYWGENLYVKYKGETIKGNYLNSKVKKDRTKSMYDYFDQISNEADVNNIVEVGCNVGRNLLYAVDRYDCEAVGFDISEEALNQARELFSDRNAHFFCRDMRKYCLENYEDNYFDLGVSMGFLMHLPKGEEKARLVKGLLRVCKHVLIYELSDMLGAKTNTGKFDYCIEPEDYRRYDENIQLTPLTCQRKDMQLFYYKSPGIEE